MNAAGSCPDDRIVLARRGAVEPREWDAFMAHVRGCPDCAAAWAAARSFERVGAARAEDEHLVRRAVQAAMAGPSRRRGLARHPALVAAAWVLLAAAVASAGALAYRELKQPRAASSEAAPPPVANRAKIHRGHRRVAAGAPSPEAPPVDEPVPLADEPPSTPAPALAEPTLPAPAAERPPAIRQVSSTSRRASLFARATAARGAGHAAEAVALFQRLQREFPGTPEATVSLVSLGELLIDAAAPEEALASFDRYLRQAPSGPLVPEALAAKARVLDQLGRPADAEKARRQLRGRIPEWPYAKAPGVGQTAGPPP